MIEGNGWMADTVNGKSWNCWNFGVLAVLLMIFDTRVSAVKLWKEGREHCGKIPSFFWVSI